MEQKSSDEEYFIIRYRGPPQYRDAVESYLTGRSTDAYEYSLLLPLMDFGRGTTIKKLFQFINRPGNQPKQVRIVPPKPALKRPKRYSPPPQLTKRPATMEEPKPPVFHYTGPSTSYQPKPVKDEQSTSSYTSRITQWNEQKPGQQTPPQFERFNHSPSPSRYSSYSPPPEFIPDVERRPAARGNLTRSQMYPYRGNGSRRTTRVPMLPPSRLRTPPIVTSQTLKLHNINFERKT